MNAMFLIDIGMMMYEIIDTCDKTIEENATVGRGI